MERDLRLKKFVMDVDLSYVAIIRYLGKNASKVKTASFAPINTRDVEHFTLHGGHRQRLLYESAYRQSARIKREISRRESAVSEAAAKQSPGNSDARLSASYAMST
jgi:hypothetical protein